MGILAPGCYIWFEDVIFRGLFLCRFPLVTGLVARLWVCGWCAVLAVGVWALCGAVFGVLRGVCVCVMC